jgi:hypothetical protein
MAIRFSETSVNPGSTQRHIREDDILHNYNDQVKEDEVGTAYSTEWGRRGMYIGYWWESYKGRDH